ncbi:MAG: 3-hydroxyacyl-CoA dehydrogenase NAD-binding domain-containing protein [Steroidobacteraceae bacterium]
MKNMRLETHADGVAVLWIDVPGRSMNVVSLELCAELDEVTARVRSDATIRGLVIASAKNAFVAGFDLKEVLNLAARNLTLKEAAALSAAISQPLRRLETCGKPVAAAIHGPALGGGYELALACHWRVMADDARTIVGLPEVRVGLLPGAGGTQRLPRMLGVARALDLILDGSHVGAVRARELGLVNEVAPREQVVERARAWVREQGVAAQPWDQKGFRIPGGAGPLDPKIHALLTARVGQVAKSTLRNYPAPIAILAAVADGSVLPLDKALAVESKYFAQLLTSPVARNLTRTMFVGKGEADKLVRRPADVPRATVTRLGVLGAGMMGSGIAYCAAKVGMTVVLVDSSLPLAERGRDYSRRLLAKEVERGLTTREAADAMLARILPSVGYAQLEGCELVIEAVFEDRQVKAEVTRAAEAAMLPGGVFASNTSTLPITGLAQNSARPNRFIGLHFFSPVDRMGLVEVIVGRKTSKATIAHALDFVGQLRKTPIVVNDSRGFYTSRVFGFYCHEGLRMLEEGVAPALIENAGRMAGMPVGPLAVSDEVSIELLWKVIRQGELDLGEKYVKPAGYEVVRRFVLELDRAGRKFGKGFYDYPEGGRKKLWTGLAQQYPLAAKQPSLEEAKQRLLYVQAMETVRCLDEGVLTHPTDGDLGSILGWGYPTWTGGTLSFIETVGVARFVKECDQLARLHGDRFRPTPKLRRLAREGRGFNRG